MSTTPMVVCVFDAHNTTPISQMSNRAVRAVDSHVYLGCTGHGLRAETMCALTNYNKKTYNNKKMDKVREKVPEICAMVDLNKDSNEED
jgi:hypothetical protein